MAQNNLTVFQKLTRTFGFKGQHKKAPQFEFNKEALLKTDSREDFERAKLLAQQTQYISDKWAKLDQSLYNQSVYYEPNRLSAYYDYESMEFTPEISAALDIYAEESTTKSEKGDILTIHSDSKRIKTILDDLFSNVLDIHTNLPMWARGMCKYGDDFVYLKIDPQKGVVGCQQMPNIEIERVEGARQSTPNQSNNITSSFPSRELRFAWKNKDMEFQAWEIAHFRLLGDDRKLPYGTCLKSDTHIKTKDGQKEIKNVRIGDEVYSFDTKTQKPVISKVLDTVNSGKKMCYKISTKHNYVDASEEHRIMYYDKSRGVFDYKNTLDFSVGDLLVVDPKSSNNHLIPIDKTKYDIKDRLTNDFIIEPIISIEKIGEYETYDIYVEDNNHNFYANGVVVHNSMLDKIRRIWKQLLLAEDAMLIYRTSRAPERRVFKVFVGNMDDKDIEPYVQRIANKFKRDQVVDQKNGQVDMRYNQMPVWSQTPIPLLDGRTITIEELSKEYLEGKENWVYSVQDNTLDIVPGKVVWCDKNYTAKKLTKIWLDDNTWIMVAPEHPMMLRDGSYLPAEDLKPGTSLMPFYTKKSNDNIEGYDMVYNPSEDSYNFIHHLTDINGGDTSTITDGIDYTKHNHKVTRIETIHQNEDVYCMTVVGPNGEDDRHNFALKSFNSDGTISVSGSFTRNSVEQDFFIPVRDPNQPSPIETLPGAQNLAEIADIEYIQKKMLAALRIPKAFLGFEDVVGNGKGLALLDIRFARTINRIQQSLIQELNKIALVHLFILGFEDELSNFTLSMTNPSGQSDLLKIESWKEKITIYKDATSDNSQMGILPVSHTWAKKNILGMSNNEIILDLQQQRLERAIGVELQNSNKIIKRSGVFDEVDKKYGIPEEEREKVEFQMGRAEGQEGEMTGGEVPGGFDEMSGLPPEPMNESRKDKILSMLNEDTSNVDNLFDMKKAQRNIYLMDKKIKEMLNE